MGSSIQPKQPFFFNISLILVYGIFVRLTFGASYFQENVLGGLVTIAFIFVMPVVLGALTVVVFPRRFKTSVLFALLVPWTSCILLGVVLLIFGWELIICIIMALPIYLPLASIGGLIVYFLASRQPKETQNPQAWLVLALLSPYAIGMIENQIPSPQSVRTVRNQIVIKAPPEIVWQQITSVPEIQPDEHYPAMFHLLGMPKPIQAMLPEGEVGAIRRSNYEADLIFIEEVTAWHPQQSYSFTIDLDPELRPSWPWNQIDGAAFELLDGIYTIEPLDEERVILHLSSRHQLTTKLNGYGGLWTDFLLGDIQGYILTVIKNRAESSAVKAMSKQNTTVL